MTVLSDRVDALEATNNNLVTLLNNLKGILEAQIAAGRGLVWQGTWTTNTNYTDVHAVSSNGRSYVCTVSHLASASTEPGVGASWQTYWDILADEGSAGWSPVFAVISDGERRVLQVVDWIGGTNAKPATGDYIGTTGYVSTIGSGVDIRGPAGTV